MCLNIVYRGKQKKEALAKLPESGYYWKAVRVNTKGRYTPLFWNKHKSFRTGSNKTKGCYCGVEYKVAFHLFPNHKEAKVFAGVSYVIIRCKVKKEDIVALGKQNFYPYTSDVRQLLTIVTTRFWCPKPK